MDQSLKVKYGALAALVLQNTFLVVFMRYSRTLPGPMYAASTAVFVMECVKFITCLFVICYEYKGIKGLWKVLSEEVISSPLEIAKLSVPSLLYTVQNNLLYFALSHLDAATFQVGYQVKILTTAVFSVLMLGKGLSKLQWFSLVILTIGILTFINYSIFSIFYYIFIYYILGVSLAQLSTSNSSDESVNTTSGFIAVLLAACTSGFSGILYYIIFFLLNI
jgi:UDP-sugar transporter A1/2/3